MKYIPLVALAFALLAVNYLLRRVILSLSDRNVVVNYVKRYLPLMELVIWTTFIIWLLNVLFAESRYLLYLNTLIFLFSFIFLSWYVLRDYVAGVQVKTRFKLIKGQKLIANGLKGEIHGIGLMSMRIRSENGRNIIVPYSKLDRQPIEFDDHQKGQSTVKFIIEIDPVATDINTTEKLTEIIMNSAWCSHKHKAVVQLLGQHDGKNQYEITCLPNGKDGGENIKTMLRQLYKN